MENKKNPNIQYLELFSLLSGKFLTVYLKVSLRGCFSSRKGIVDGSQNHSTVTDLAKFLGISTLDPFIRAI